MYAEAALESSSFILEEPPIHNLQMQTIDNDAPASDMYFALVIPTTRSFASHAFFPNAPARATPPHAQQDNVLLHGLPPLREVERALCGARREQFPSSWKG